MSNKTGTEIYIEHRDAAMAEQLTPEGARRLGTSDGRKAARTALRNAAGAGDSKAVLAALVSQHAAFLGVPEAKPRKRTASAPKNGKADSVDATASA